MTLSRFGAVATFQVTFTELFIAATVIATAAYRFGWRSVAFGSFLGAAGVAVLAALLQVAAYRIALHWLDWISALLLLGFGLYLAYEFLTGLGERHGPDVGPHGAGWDLPVNAGGVGVAAWALAAEGLEILGGPDGEGRGRPIRTVQPSQRGCGQARCRGRVAQRPPRGSGRKPATAEARAHERSRFTS